MIAAEERRIIAPRAPGIAAPEVDLAYVEEAVARYGTGPQAVLPLLQALQDHYGYLPEQALQKLTTSTRITPAAVSGVATFYDMFRHKPVGKHIIRVCRGTACHVSGAERVEDAIRRHLKVEAGQDTDAEGQYTVEQVACLGCCTLAPVVRIGDATFGHSTAERVPAMLREFEERGANGHAAPSTEELRAHVPASGEIRIGLGSCCIAKGSDSLYHALQKEVERTNASVSVKRVGCVGMCHRTPMIEVSAPGGDRTSYAGLDATQAGALVRRHFRAEGLVPRARAAASSWLDSLFSGNPGPGLSSATISPKETSVCNFLGAQVHIATEHFGEVDPLDLDEYVRQGGFKGLARCVRHLRAVGNAGVDYVESASLMPHEIPGLIEQAGLRGRGGAGFPTGAKWRLAAAEASEAKYIICNGDEGDPGAFMDRMLLESFPFRIIEGMAVAAVAIGAHDGIFYIRHEYPLALKRVRAAIKLCRQRGWLGERLLGRDFRFDVTIQQGGGAFVCGEETALIESLEGRRGMPRLRPPFPAVRGLWDKPTIINNVETLAMVPWILRNGPEAFASYGTPRSRGTKVFALAGNVRHGGLIEVPMGTTIRKIVEEIGGGVQPGRTFKAVQIGGPSGGCIPAALADTPVDFESLRDAGAIMGSGGLVVLDDTACMVDIARYFLQFTQQQSCGKCTFCRIGTRRMLEILERICAGKGHSKDLAHMEGLAGQVTGGSLCGLGKTAPNPVLTTLRYFRDEYEAHLQGRCPAGKCSALIQYRILDNCTGCTLCAQRCPVDAIPLAPYQRHWIDMEKCIRCDSCRQVCPHDAVEKK